MRSFASLTHALERQLPSISGAGMLRRAATQTHATIVRTHAARCRRVLQLFIPLNCANDSAGDASIAIRTGAVEADREVVLVRKARVLVDAESKRRQILREAAGVALLLGGEDARESRLAYAVNAGH